MKSKLALFVLSMLVFSSPLYAHHVCQWQTRLYRGHVHG